MVKFGDLEGWIHLAGIVPLVEIFVIKDGVVKLVIGLLSGLMRTVRVDNVWNCIAEEKMAFDFENSI